MAWIISAQMAEFGQMASLLDLYNQVLEVEVPPAFWKVPQFYLVMTSIWVLPRLGTNL